MTGGGSIGERRGIVVRVGDKEKRGLDGVGGSWYKKRKLGTGMRFKLSMEL